MVRILTCDTPRDTIGQLGDLNAGRRLHPTEPDRSIGSLDIHTVKEQHMELGIGLVPQVVLWLYVGILLNSLVVPERGAVLMQASHSAYYALYSIFMERHGYSSSTIGWLWALGVIAEVLVFLVMHHLLHRWGARLVFASLLIAVVRWILIPTAPETLILVLLSQTMHAATFGTFHAAAIHLVHHYFIGRHQGRGQALYSSISFGAGGAFSSLLSGYLWTSISPGSIFWVAVGYAGLAVVIAWRWVGLKRDRMD
jgi:PPP family 3-phenylpropionic acid transporter